MNQEKGSEQSQHETKEGKFHGGIAFSRQDLLGPEELIHDEKEKLLIASLVIGVDGRPYVKKGLYARALVPKGTSPDYGAAEYYDDNPEIKLIEINPVRAKELLTEKLKALEAAHEELNHDQDFAEDEWEASKFEESISDSEHQLEEVREALAKLKTG